MTTAIILAGGKSSRMGGKVDKAFVPLVNKPVVAWSLLAFERSRDIDRIVLVVRKEQLEASQAVVKMFGISKIDKIVAGGRSRLESMQLGLKACDLDTRTVFIHDAARPMVTGELIAELAQLVKRTPAVTVGRPVTDTLKKCAPMKGNVVAETVERERLWAVQTPQVFQIKELRAALKTLGKTEVTDDSQILEKAGVSVKIFEYLKPNFKITTIEDLQLVSELMK